ncbi:MAG: pseudouridine synthase [Verrucomicrobia bacterium]|nr:pseudouridine synthase [Verrucomicrobiota bacterium]MDA1086336.1 pseudouridine synthase [Verrucomicrobiota bacterium]
MGSPKPRPNDPDRCRLQKHLAQCGIGSRRACEELIAGGSVSVNDQIVTQLGTSIDPNEDVVCVDGRRVRRERHVYILLNKPRDVLCTASDPQGRKIFKDLLQAVPVRTYTVGRLDRDSEGMLIVTNDGRLAQHLTHPRYHVKKHYRVWTEGRLSKEQIRRMRDGIESDGEMLVAADIRLEGDRDGLQRYHMELQEGRKRQIRRMFAACGQKLWRLQRIAIGGMKLGALKPGDWRYLEDAEIRQLCREAQCPELTP